MASTLVLIVVFIFDVVAFGLAVAAEQRRSTAKIEQDSAGKSYCVYESDIATGLGAGAFLILLASQIVIMIASRCFCCGRGMRPGAARAWAIILFITCWVTFFIAEVCLLAGSVRNAYHTKYRSFLADNLSCQTLRKGVFGAAAAFTFFTCIVTELYYVSYSKANVEKVQPPPSIGMSAYR